MAEGLTPAAPRGEPMEYRLPGRSSWNHSRRVLVVRLAGVRAACAGCIAARQECRAAARHRPLPKHHSSRWSSRHTRRNRGGDVGGKINSVPRGPASKRHAGRQEKRAWPANSLLAGDSARYSHYAAQGPLVPVGQNFFAAPEAAVMSARFVAPRKPTAAGKDYTESAVREQG